MDYEEFAARVEEDMRSLHPEMTVEDRSIDKLQGESYRGMMVGEPGSPVAATINLDAAYEEFQNGTPYSDIVTALSMTVEQAKLDMPEIDPAVLRDYDHMKETLTMQLISTEKNQDMLSKIPHETMEDMSVVYRFQVNRDENGSASILVTNDMLKSYGITHDQLREDAQRFAPENTPVIIRNMSDVMNEMMGGAMEFPESPMVVASLEGGVNGAGCLAYPDFMDQAAEKMGGDFFILPSSIHEVLLLPDDGSATAQELNDMVVSVNETEVQPSERLSNQAFHYDTENKLFETALNYEARINGEISMEDHGMETDEPKETITALLIEPDKYPRQIELGTRLEDLQEAVGGNVEFYYPSDPHAVMIMNEEGKIQGLPLNRALRDRDGNVCDIAAGSMLVVGTSGDGIVDLTPDQLKNFEAAFHQPETFVRMGHSVMPVPLPDEVVKAKAREAEQNKEGDHAKTTPDKKPKHKKPDHDGH